MFDPLPGDPPPPPERVEMLREFLTQHRVRVVLVEYLDLADQWFDHLIGAGAAAVGKTGDSAPVGAGAGVDPLDRLAQLNELRQAGALTEAEFDAQKAKLLGTG